MPVPTDFEPGKMWIAASTPRNRLNDIPADSFVWITFGTHFEVSIMSTRAVGVYASRGRR